MATILRKGASINFADKSVILIEQEVEHLGLSEVEQATFAAFVAANTPH